MRVRGKIKNSYWGLCRWAHGGIEKHLKASKPVMIFFKKTVDTNNCDLDQISRLKDFKKAIDSKALYIDHDNAFDFQKILTDKLTLCINVNYIKKLL